MVMPDGSMSLGYYGFLDVDGLTPHEIETKLKEHLRRFERRDDLAVSVQVVKRNSRPANLVDWISGRVTFREVKNLRLF